MESLKTGDILLCRGDSGDDMIDKVIEDFTHSPYIHVGMVITKNKTKKGYEINIGKFHCYHFFQFQN